MGAHTPGPWAIRDALPYTVDGALVYSAAPGAASETICRVDNKHWPHAAENLALIADAPAMAERLTRADAEVARLRQLLERIYLQAAPATGVCPDCERIQRWIALADVPHTHPCPTCHHDRPCTGTGCADGPRECHTCSQCRGW